MPIPHVYEKVVKKSDVDLDGQSFNLEDGTILVLPRIAWREGQKVEVGDNMLIDLSEWETSKECATVKVIRDGYMVTEFSMGHNCQLETPLFDKQK